MAVPSLGYGEVQNAIKEIDMQIVYRRLEARKRNITNDGKMSRKQLATAYRGYHGLEAQYHALLRMSDEAMMNVKAKNDHVHLKHSENMRTLEEQRRSISRQSRREMDSISQEFRAQLAYQYVYKNHSFKRLDQSKTPKKPRPTSDKPEMYDPDRKMSTVQRSNSIIRPLGSLRQMETYKDELKLPELHDGYKEKREKEKSKVNMMGDKFYHDSRDTAESDSNAARVQKSFPKIEGALGVEIKYRYKTKADDKDSLFSAPAGVVDDEAVVYANQQPALAQFDLGRNLMLMRQKEQENYNRQRLLPIPPTTDDKKQGWRRVLPPTPSRPSSVFPRQETNPIDHRKVMRREVSELIDNWAHANTAKRMELVEKVKQLEREQEIKNPQPKFDRSRPTSAIIRDFQEYKKMQEERRYTVDKNQPITVKQIDVQPRPESPSVSRRNQYSAKITTAGRLRRTASERTEKSDDKFSSISRTVSCKEVMEDPIEMAENAQLTAAERIEKEKEKRNSAKQRLPVSKAENNKQQTDLTNNIRLPTSGVVDIAEVKRETIQQTRRQLPATPRSADSGEKQPTEQKERKYNPSDVYLKNQSKPINITQKKKQEKMFDTSILAKTSDFQTIDEVRKANESQDVPIPLKKLRPGTPSSFESAQESSSTPVYMFSSKPIPQNIRQRMKFEYDNYSRTTPTTKKKLEIRAKNRRKIQQQNKLLFSDGTASTIKDSDRASTQVSFDENVMVFQTI